MRRDRRAGLGPRLPSWAIGSFCAAQDNACHGVSDDTPLPCGERRSRPTPGPSAHSSAFRVSLCGLSALAWVPGQCVSDGRPCRRRAVRAARRSAVFDMTPVVHDRPAVALERARQLGRPDARQALARASNSRLSSQSRTTPPRAIAALATPCTLAAEFWDVWATCHRPAGRPWHPPRAGELPRLERR
jgi:hypothetical protein